MRSQVDVQQIAPVIHGYHENPFEVLGPHEIEESGRRALAVRAYLPDSQQVWVVDQQHGLSHPMRRIHPAGLFEAICNPEIKQQSATPSYKFRAVNQAGEERTMHDHYAFPPLLTDYDLHLLAEGRHWDSYERLGAHVREIDGIVGINFAVWAPNAEAVSIVGDFNGWDRRTHAMRKHIPSGNLGVVHSRFAGWHAVQVLGQSTRRARGREMRSLWLCCRGSTENGQYRRGSGCLPMVGRRVDGIARAAQRTRRADVDLRSAPGKLANQRRRQPLEELSRPGS